MKVLRECKTIQVASNQENIKGEFNGQYCIKISVVYSHMLDLNSTILSSKTTVHHSRWWCNIEKQCCIFALDKKTILHKGSLFVCSGIHCVQRGYIKQCIAASLVQYNQYNLWSHCISGRLGHQP